MEERERGEKEKKKEREKVELVTIEMNRKMKDMNTHEKRDFE